MSGNAPPMVGPLPRPRAASHAERFAAASRAVVPSLLFGLRLWASVSLALYAAFWLELDNPYWAGTSAAIVCQVQLGASLRKGWFRMIGTVIGAAMSVVLVACFPQDRILFFGALAVWGAACAFAATLLRNFASYAAALAGYTAAIIAGDLFGAVGGVDANAAFLLAVSRATEICLGIVCAGIVLAGTDFGGARRRLAAHFADLLVEITAGFTRTLATVGRAFVDTQFVRREYVRRIVALVPVIDQALGESSQVRYHSPVLENAVDGLFMALSGWSAVANHVHQQSAGETRHEAAAVLECVPRELRSALQPDALDRWIGDPVALHKICELTVRRLIALPAVTPSMRLVADRAAEAFAGIAHALNGLALLAADPARPIQRRASIHVRVPDWLPALVNGGRAFVTIGAVALFWIVTAWPGGGDAITFATMFVLLLGPLAEQAYGAAILFTVGTVLDLVVTATIAFAVLPGLGIERFASFSLVLAVCLVPIGALLAHARHGWQVGLFTAMTMFFMPVLQPTNPMTYNPEVFYNVGSAIVFGIGFAALSFRILPPLSPAFRTRRLLALTLRDLRRLAIGRSQPDWQGRVLGRLAAMPDEATPLQRTQLLATLSAGSEIIYLRHIAHDLGLGPKLDAALAALAEGHSGRAIARLTRLDDVLATDDADGPEPTEVLRARASILVLAEALTKHSAYFDAEAQS
ncbi:MAG TPA: FUSC family protein [Acetobacteraceae bacterium]|nr:FUSC family protein [Acetobacteraceae bacterium]